MRKRALWICHSQQHFQLWRGLKFLVDRTDFSEDIQINLLTAAREQFGEDMREHVLSPASAAQVDNIPCMPIIPYAIDNHTPDLEQLQALGETACELQIPVLISTSPAFSSSTQAPGRTPCPTPEASCPARSMTSGMR